jgi:dolichol-phosphate mannosyltransferase
MKLTIVIPTYNEADNLPVLMGKLFDLPLSSVNIIVVDDASPDRTGEIAEGLKLQHPGKVTVIHRVGKLGLGTAYLLGFERALTEGAEFVVQMDADFSHPPEKLLEMAATLQNCDVVIGSRYITGGRLDDQWPFWRKSLSGFGNLYARTILRVPIKDVTGGYRIWRRKTLLGMPLERIQSNGYAFQVEMAYVAYRLGYQLKEIPIYFADRQWGESKMSLKIQIEAAIRVWMLLWEYQDLR